MYGHFLLACKEMATRRKKLLIWMVLLHFEFCQLVSPMPSEQYCFNGNLMVSNDILAFSVGLVLFYNSLYRGMYVFWVQCFENATIVACVDLRVKGRKFSR